MRALVIDDSRAMRMILSRKLEQFGYTVAQAANGKDALEQIGRQDQGSVSLFLVDWNMPEMNGLELVQAVRHDHRLSGMRMMMVTTETEMANVTKAIEAGANEYVMKPFTKDAIIDKIRVMGIGV